MFEDFTRWYAARCVRSRGAAPAASTQRGTEMRLRALLHMSGAESPERFGALISDRNAMVQLLDELYACKASGTVKADLVALRQFGEYAIANGCARRVAIEADDAPKSLPLRPIVVYERAEVERLLSCARAHGNVRYWAFLATVIDSGRRVGEILGLRWDNMKLNATPPHFDLPTTKNKRQAYVPLTRRLREDVWTDATIQTLKTTADPRIRPRILVQPFPWRYRTVQDKLRRQCEIANVPYRGHHAFRHTKATELLARGVPMQAVSALLGHANVTTTDRVYNHTTALSYVHYID
jgi:integrase